ncbi:hypothetical protein B0H13DRAFT_1851948 [Mycena leptocephala]|nr:hypothetical protein B0H13DRAFT_1851948 [Mycena leptocephala]
MPEAEMDNGVLSSESTEETDLKQTVPDRSARDGSAKQRKITDGDATALEALILAEIEGDGEYVNPTVGAMLIGVMVQQSLVGYIFAQGCSYYKFKDRDSQLYRYLVAGLLAFSTLEAAMDMHVIYRSMVTHYGEYGFFDLQTWSMWAEPGVTVFFVSSSYSYAILTHGNGMIGGRGPPRATVLRGEVLEDHEKVVDGLRGVDLFARPLSLGSGVAVSISFFKVRLFSELRKIPIPISIWLISTAVADIIIAGILCVGLYGARTSVKRTETVLMKLIVLSVETSSCTAICAILNLVFYFVLKNTAYHLIPQFSLCRFYTITVLFTLLQRDGLRNDLDVHTFHDFVRPTITEVNMTTTIEHALESSIMKPGSKESQTDPDSVWSNV